MVTLKNQKEAKKDLPTEHEIRGFVRRLAKELEWAYSELQKEIDRDLRLMSGIEDRENTIRKQTIAIQNNEATIQDQANEIKKLQNRLRRVESSKLMRIQRKYWNFRKRLKG